MINQYYTPRLEDIRIGYECEIGKSEGPFKIQKFIVDEDQVQYAAFLIRADNLIRTPYLTKEQIEAEGWVHTGGKLSSDSRQDFEKIVGVRGTCELHYVPLNHKLKITQRNHVRDGSGRYSLLTIYDGYCPSINEFRTICNLLNLQ